MNTILLVEDELDLAHGLVDVLRLKGYAVDHAETGERAAELLAQHYDLLILDVSLPGMSGFDLLRSLAVKPATIMLTSRSSEMDKVIGFELGIEDYVTKPFSLLELLARIQVVLRRAQPVSRALQFGEVVLDLEKFSIRGREITLPARAFDMLKVLHQRRGQAVSRDELIDGVWGVDENVTQRTLNNLIVKIRQAIEVDPEQPRHLLTVHGVGYRLES
jgi:DNA-binding response OmpR family regulator